jgi:hypothetical protein
VGVFWGGFLSSWVDFFRSAVGLRPMPTLGAMKPRGRWGTRSLGVPDCCGGSPDVVVAEKSSSVGLGLGLFGGYAGCFAVEEGGFLG